MASIKADANDHPFVDQADTIPYFDASHFLPNAGPRNYDSSNYAMICLYRPASAQGGNYWFAVFANNEEIARISENCRFLVKVPIEGKIYIDARYNNISAVELDVKFHQTYYIRVEGAVVSKKVTANIYRVNQDQAHEENNRPGWKDYYIDYPWPDDISHIHMFQKIKYQPEYILNLSDSIPFYEAKFLPPGSARFFYYLRNSEPYEIPHMHFVYENWLLSHTFFKEINIYREDHKYFDSTEELLNYVKNNIKDGNRLIRGTKDSVSELGYEVFPETGNMAAGFFAELNQLKKDSAGHSYMALRREYVVYLFKKPAGARKLFPITGKLHGLVVLISEIGLPDEIHSFKEMRQEILKFCSGISF